MGVPTGAIGAGGQKNAKPETVSFCRADFPREIINVS